MGIGSVPEVESSEELAAGQAAVRPKPQSKAVREAEAQARALRIQLAQFDELAGIHGPDKPSGS